MRSSSGGPSQRLAKLALSQVDQPARYQAVRRQARGCSLRQGLVDWHVDCWGVMLLFPAQEGVVSGYVRSPKASQLRLWDALIGQANQRWKGLRTSVQRGMGGPHTAAGVAVLFVWYTACPAREDPRDLAQCLDTAAPSCG